VTTPDHPVPNEPQASFSASATSNLQAPCHRISHPWLNSHLEQPRMGVLLRQRAPHFSPLRSSCGWQLQARCGKLGILLPRLWQQSTQDPPKPHHFTKKERKNDFCEIARSQHTWSSRPEISADKKDVSDYVPSKIFYENMVPHATPYHIRRTQNQ
jgi:hypothetical protein